MNVKKIIIPVISLIIIFVLLITFLAKPAITGYAVNPESIDIKQTVEKSKKDYLDEIESLQTEVEELQIKLIKSETNISTCTVFNDKLFDEYKESNNKYAECLTNLGSTNTDLNVIIKDYEKEISFLRKELNKEKEKNNENQKLVKIELI